MNIYQNFIDFMKNFQKKYPLVQNGYNYSSFIGYYLNFFHLNLNYINNLLKNKYHSKFIKTIDSLEKLDEYIDRSYVLDNNSIYIKFP